MSLLDHLSALGHAERALRTTAADLRTLAGKVDELRTSDHSARALRHLARELDTAGPTAEGKLARYIAGALERFTADLSGLERVAAVLDATSKQLKRTSSLARTDLSAPSDHTPPDGLYLEQLDKALGSEYEWTTPALSRWLVSKIRKARSMVRRLLGPAEITAEAELIEEAKLLLEEIDKGPTIEQGR